MIKCKTQQIGEIMYDMIAPQTESREMMYVKCLNVRYICSILDPFMLLFTDLTSDASIIIWHKWCPI